MTGAGADDVAGAGGRDHLTRAGRSPITVDELEQWTDHGATWRALEISDEHAVVELCTCYGEPVDVREGVDVQVIEYLRAHRDD